MLYPISAKKLFRSIKPPQSQYFTIIIIHIINKKINLFMYKKVQNMYKISIFILTKIMLDLKYNAQLSKTKNTKNTE